MPPSKLNTLPFKIIIPITAIMLLTGIPLYILILNTVTDFARQNIKKDLEDLSRYTFDIADRGFMDLVREGKTTDRIATRLKQVDSLDAIELFMRDRQFSVIISSRKNQKLLLGSGLQTPARTETNAEIQQHTINGGPFFSRQIYFSPWDWDITVLKDAKKYADLSGQITFFSSMVGMIWFLGTVLLIAYVLKTVQAPIHKIITAVNAGFHPQYRGTYELEFLSTPSAR